MQNKTTSLGHITIRLAQEADLKAILVLQKANLGKNLNATERQKNGFVMLETPLHMLKELQQNLGIWVAESHNKIIAFLFGVTVPQALKNELLAPEVHHVSPIIYKGKSLAAYRYFIIGQICVDDEFKGYGIAGMLYQELFSIMAGQYDLVIASVNQDNARSLHVHTKKIGMNAIGQYEFSRNHWIILCKELNPL